LPLAESRVMVKGQGAAARGFPSEEQHVQDTRLTVVDRRPVAITVETSGDIDLATRDRLEDVRRQLSTYDDLPVVLVDLSATEFMDCTGVSFLVALRQDLAARDAHLYVTGANRPIRRLLDITGLAGLIVGGAPERVRRPELATV
jgi:anti-anti-sigma factor